MELPLADTLAALSNRISGIMLGSETVEEAVQSLAVAAKKAVPQASGAGATLIEGRGRATSSGATDPIVAEADRLQYELGEGPCLSAWAEQRVIRMDDIQDEVRWPRWTWEVSNLALRSCVSVPLAIGDTALGALTVYSSRAEAFSDSSVRLLEMFVRPAALMLATAQAGESAQRLSGELVSALAARDVIKTASGILMERLGVSSDRAMEAMIAAARRDNKTLSVIAQELIDGHPTA